MKENLKLYQYQLECQLDNKILKNLSFNIIQLIYNNKWKIVMIPTCNKKIYYIISENKSFRISKKGKIKEIVEGNILINNTYNSDSKIYFKLYIERNKENDKKYMFDYIINKDK